MPYQGYVSDVSRIIYLHESCSAFSPEIKNGKGAKDNRVPFRCPLIRRRELRIAEEQSRPRPIRQPL